MHNNNATTDDRPCSF